MEAKSFSPMRYFWRFFTRCLPIAFTPTSAILFTSEREITFPPNCSKFAVECDWNRKNSQNLKTFKIWFFFGKIDEFFFENNLEIFQNRYIWKIFSRMRLKWYFFENVFPPYLWGFFGKNQKKIKVGKVRKYDEETDYFEKKTLSFF